MQVDPIKPTLKACVLSALNTNCDEPLTNVALIVSCAATAWWGLGMGLGAAGQGQASAGARAGAGAGFRESTGWVPWTGPQTSPRRRRPMHG